eukprot:3513231-Pyramimonas_sp.AAC.1
MSLSISINGTPRNTTRHYGTPRDTITIDFTIVLHQRDTTGHHGCMPISRSISYRCHFFGTPRDTTGHLGAPRRS